METNTKRRIPTRVKRDYIKMMLSTNDSWMAKALMKIFDRQTNEEKNIHHTVEHNGIGFTGTDAFILSSFAKQFRDKKYLSKKQMDILKKKIPKYWAQIYEISDKSLIDPKIEEYANRVGIQTQLKLKLKS